MKPFNKAIPMRVILLGLVIGFSFLLSSCKQEPITPISISTPIGISFPAISTKEIQALTITHLKALNIDKIKMEVSWESVEKEIGVYSWDNLDYRINTFVENDIEVFLMISSSLPPIHQTSSESELTLNNLAVYESFLTALISRYEDKITKIQFGNEWDNLEQGYQNSIDNYIGLNNSLYTITKSINPSIDVVLGGMTSGYLLYKLMDEYDLEIEQDNRMLIDIDQRIASFEERMLDWIDQGIESRINRVLDESFYDIADIHMYDEAELFDDIYNLFSTMVDTPILISEYGAPNPDYERYSQKYQLNRTTIILDILAPLDLVEIYHFSLFDHDAYHANNGLLDNKGNEKLIYELYQTRIVEK